MDNRTEIMLDNIGMTYKTTDGRDVTALTSVSLDIKKGEFISLLGTVGLRQDNASADYRRHPPAHAGHDYRRRRNSPTGSPQAASAMA